MLQLRPFALAVLLAAVCVAATALAHEPDGPPLGAELRVELQDDALLARDEGRDGIHTVFATLELGLEARLSSAWFLDAGLVLEPVRDPDAGRSQLFGGHGTYLETLALRLEGKHITARLGKLTPRFGIAWDRAAGIYGSDFAEDYELAERWGLEGGVRLDAGRWGLHWLGASAFTVDSSPLSRSLLTDRGRVRRSDGGPGNMGRPDSFAVSLDGSGLEHLAGLRYHAAFVQQGRGRADTGHERAVALGLELPLALPAAGIQAAALFEHVRVFDAAGSPGSAHYATASLALARGPWHGAVALSSRRMGGTDRTRDRMLELSGGYRFASGLDVELGWRAAREGGAGSQVLGVRISRLFTF